MVATRLDSQSEHLFTGAIADMQTDLDELKAGVQYVEPKLYDLSTANTYDLSGTFTASALNTTVIQIIITVQSTDGTPLLVSIVPTLWMDSTSSPYVDTLNATAYGVNQSIQVSDDPTKAQYFVNISSRNNISGNFWAKVNAYASSPATMTIARTI
jgi:hypothetical protein